MSDSKPREYWVYFQHGNHCVAVEKLSAVKGAIHMIEYSAYEAAIKERDEARAEIAKGPRDSWETIAGQWRNGMHNTEKRLREEQAKLANLVAAVRDLIVQLKDQGVCLPGEIDSVEDMLKDAPIEARKFPEEFARDHFSRKHPNCNRNSSPVNHDMVCARWGFEQASHTVSGDTTGEP